jgi:hypothetical protein
MPSSDPWPTQWSKSLALVHSETHMVKYTLHVHHLKLIWYCPPPPYFPQVLLRELLIASEDKMSVMAGPEFVYIIASLAKLRASPDTPWINRWLAMSRHRLVRGAGGVCVVGGRVGG